MLRPGQLLPPKGLSTLGFDAGRFCPDAASLLPGLLAVTRTGPSPAGGHDLVDVGHLKCTTSFRQWPVPTPAGHEKRRLAVRRAKFPPINGLSKFVRHVGHDANHIDTR